jgi:shikimate dehydrogenase
VINGAVLGSPISHSLSPILHKSAFEFLGIEGSYRAQEVQSGELANFFSSHRDENDYFSITMPLKEEALALDVAIDATALRIQSANTLYKRDGQWNLTSTDGSGIVSALSHAGHASFQSVLVLGAGGTARAVVGALDSISAKIEVLGRSDLRRSALEEAVESCEFSYVRWTHDIDFSQFDCVINTTPAGAADLLADYVPRGIDATLFDVIYKPWPTVLASRWRDCGGEVINGLELLLYQGIDQLEYVVGTSFDRHAMAEHIRPILRAHSR